VVLPIEARDKAKQAHRGAMRGGHVVRQHRVDGIAIRRTMS
jgi:hypothetical protein